MSAERPDKPADKPADKAPYRARRVEPAAAEAEVVELWRKYRDGLADATAVFRWYYQASPIGPSSCFLVDHGEEPVGLTGLGERTLELDGQPARAALMGNFLVGKQHRTLFPALTLQRAVVAWGKARYELLYGFPNQAAVPVVRRIGFATLGAFGRYVDVLRYRPYVAKRTRVPGVAWAAGLALDVGTRLRARVRQRRFGRSAFELETITAPDERFDQLWAARTWRPRAAGTRGAAFVRWRFCERPDERVELFGLRARATGELHAYAAVHSDGTTASIRDLIGRSVCDVGALLPLLRRTLRARGLTSISFLFLGAPELERRLLAHGFQRRDTDRVLIAYRGDACAVDAAFLAQRDHWYLTEADEDQ